MDTNNRECKASEYFVGLDLGKEKDFTALALVERAELEGDWDAVAYANRREIELRLRRLQRLPLGTSYPEVEEIAARAVDDVVRQAGRRGKCELIVDATGVGRGVVDHLRRTLAGRAMRGVIVTAGQTERHEGGYDLVPKKDLMVGLQVLIEFHELKIARGMRFIEELKKEMAAMRVKVSRAGNEQFGAWREGEHDDLVFAVALGCWAAEKRHPGKLSGWDGYWVGGRAVSGR